MATVLISFLVIFIVLNTAMVLVTHAYGCYVPEDSPCYNTTLSCSSMLMFIKNLYYKTQPGNPTCPPYKNKKDCKTNPCCTRTWGEAEGASQPFSKEESLTIIKACTHKRSCTVNSPYRPDTGYHYIEYGYGCVFEHGIDYIMRAGNVVRDTYSYTYYNGKDSAVKGLTCSCDITSASTRTVLYIRIIYLLKESCKGLTITGDDQPIYTCDDNGVFMGYTDSPIYRNKYRILLNNMTSSNEDLLLVMFYGTRLNISCDCSKVVMTGGWTSWTYTTCSVSCGNGTWSRTRKCENPAPTNGGADCVGESTEQSECNILACPVDGGWGEWSAYSTCLSTCGNGLKTRARQCSNPAPAHGGNNCTGNSTDMVDCNLPACPVDGGWGEWSAYSTCLSTCGNGLKTRTRHCSNPAPAYGGNNCTGNSTDEVGCNLPECPVNGGWSEWFSYSSCTVTCGGGVKTRTKQCNNPPPAHGGASCIGNSHENMACNQILCPGIGGSWGEWSSSSTCSVPCGGGIRTRTRQCNNPTPVNEGASCSGNNYEHLICNKHACPGTYLQWIFIGGVFFVVLVFAIIWRNRRAKYQPVVHYGHQGLEQQLSD